MIFHIIFLIYLIICTVTDLKTRKINLVISLIYFLIGITCQIFFIPCDSSILFLNLLPGFFLLVISKTTKGAIGCGDAIIFVNMALFLRTFSALNVLFFSLIIASCFSLILLCKKYSKNYAFPFAPFILSGYLITFLMSGGSL